MPRDGGHFILSDEEKNELLAREPDAKPYVRSYVGAEEMLNGGSRWCLWLVDAKPEMLRSLPLVMERVEAVRQFRLSSKAAATRKFASTPSLFCQIAQPTTGYLMVPSVSSERRQFIPIAPMRSDVIASNLVFTIEGGNSYHLGVLSSTMHMAWVRYTCGRLESRYRYSKDIVYNNFPWPENPTQKQISSIQEAAHAVLTARQKHSAASLADLYDPVAMPPNLARAHTTLDRAVDAAYGRTFASDAARISFLFDLYQRLTSFLPRESAPARVKPRRSRK